MKDTQQTTHMTYVPTSVTEQKKLTVHRAGECAFILKKTERLVSALYLITDLFHDSDPLKWELRNEGVELLACVAPCQDSISKATYAVLPGKLASMMSLLDVAFDVGLVSQMNHFVLHKELSGFSDRVRDIVSHTDGSELTHEYFASRDTYPHTSTQKELTTQTKEKDIPSRKKDTNALEHKRQREEHTGKRTTTTDASHDRRKNIMRLLEKGKAYTIRDIAHNMAGCSEKTVQRDLLFLSDQGVLKKEGARRWTTYTRT